MICSEYPNNVLSAVHISSQNWVDLSSASRIGKSTSIPEGLQIQNLWSGHMQIQQRPLQVGSESLHDSRMGHRRLGLTVSGEAAVKMALWWR